MQESQSMGRYEEFLMFVINLHTFWALFRQLTHDVQFTSIDLTQ